jgi:hypothetical protein
MPPTLEARTADRAIACLRKAIEELAAGLSSGVMARMKPITGMADCCARAASGHAVAPPSSVMNLRRSYVEHGLPSGIRCASLPQAQDVPKAPLSFRSGQRGAFSAMR